MQRFAGKRDAIGSANPGTQVRLSPVSNGEHRENKNLGEHAESVSQRPGRMIATKAAPTAQTPQKMVNVAHHAEVAILDELRAQDT